MAVQLDQNGKDDLKTQFVTREGTYRLMTLSEYSRPNRVGYQTNQNNPQVRVSLVSLPTSNYQVAASTVGQTVVAQSQFQSSQPQPQQQQHPPQLPQPQSSSTSSSLGAPSINGQPDCLESSTANGGDRICFNFGKELYVYAYRGCKKLTSDLSKPIDKKLYKGTNPSCHDFNEAVALNDGAPLLVGFTTGQIQLVQPGKREPGRLYNEERFIDKTKVTCLKWLPKSPNLFLASHSSGYLYLYNEELPCTPAAPNYQPFKTGDGYTILTCKSKTTRNPLYKWTFGTDNCSINEFCFSPCGQMLAIVSQDGFLRVFNYDKMELIGVARSYFGGFLCVCWSPDGKYIVVGGEDDLVTVWSVQERRVVARGQGHRSWVSVVAFDPYTSYSNWDGPDFSDDENPINDGYICYNNENHNDVDCESNPIANSKRPNSAHRDSNIIPEKLGTSYRLGSVSQDTQLCLWDITEDILRQSYEIRQRLSSYDPQVNGELSSGNITQHHHHHHQQQQQQQQPQPQCNEVKANPSASCLNVGGGIKDSVDGSSSSKNSSNSSSKSGSKFATANCTSGSESGRSSVNELNSSKHLNSSNKSSSNSGKSQVYGNNITIIGNSTSTTTSDVSNKSTTTSSSKATTTATGAGGSTTESGLTAFNSITQRLSNFSFGNDKKSTSSATSDSHSSSHSHKKPFTFSKSTGNHMGFLHSNNVTTTNSSDTVLATSLKNTKTTTTTNNSVVPSYDPMQLIGTSVCPRFDECPLLEPLVCKKIAHERLTALIFREDCFLTACQDGFIYTWARPGYSNIPQHISASPSAPPGGTVV